MDSAPNAHNSILCATYFVLADDHRKESSLCLVQCTEFMIYTYRQLSDNTTTTLRCTAGKRPWSERKLCLVTAKEKKKRSSKYVMRKVCFLISVFPNVRQHQRMQIKMKLLRQLAKQILFLPGKAKQKNRMLSTGMKCYFVFNK